MVVIFFMSCRFELTFRPFSLGVIAPIYQLSNGFSIWLRSYASRLTTKVCYAQATLILSWFLCWTRLKRAWKRWRFKSTRVRLVPPPGRARQKWQPGPISFKLLILTWATYCLFPKNAALGQGAGSAGGVGVLAAHLRPDSTWGNHSNYPCRGMPH